MDNTTYGIVPRAQVEGYYTTDNVVELANLLLEHSEYYAGLREEGLYTEECLFEMALEEAEGAFLDEGLELVD
jgi:hypothetical protein